MENLGQSGKQENPENLENRGTPKHRCHFELKASARFRNLYTRAHLESSRCRPQLRPQERIEAAREELAAQALEIGPLPLLATGLPDECDDRLFHRFQDCMCVCVCVCVRAQLRTAALFSSPADEVIN